MGENDDRHPPEGRGCEKELLSVTGAIYRAVIDTGTDPVFVKDSSFRLVMANQGFADFTGYRQEEILGKDDFDLFRKEEAAEYRKNDREAFSSGKEVEAEEEYTDSHGVTHTVLVKKRPYVDSEGNRFLVGLARDITELKTAQTLLRRSEERFRSIFENAAAGMATISPDGELTAVNPAFCRMLGYSVEELLGLTVRDITHPEDRKRTAQFLRDAARGKTAVFREEKRYLRRDGSAVWGLTTAAFQCDEKGRPISGVALVQEITHLKKSEEAVRRLAYYDSLTDLPNRALLMERLRHNLYQAERDGRKVGLLYFDLDYFKKINDTLGHHTGDLLLKAAAGRLRECVRRSDTAARIGGDEFVVVLPNLPSEHDVAAAAGHILDTMSRPFHLNGREVFTSASMGIAIFPDDGSKERALLKNADRAMYEAKEKGRNQFRFFSGEINERVERRAVLENELRQTLVREKAWAAIRQVGEEKEFPGPAGGEGELFLHYQPQIELLSGEISCMEALVRWQHPRRGLVTTTEFIEAAEETGLILNLGEWILRRVCSQNRAWQNRGLPCRRLATNLSRAQISQPGVTDLLDRVLGETGLDARWLEIELTEKILQDYSPGFVSTLEKIRNRGVRISVDDFGTGYSSLRHLREYPLDRFKIAQELVRRLPADGDAAAVVETVIAMARGLGIRVVAEGVESRGQLEFLRARGCQEVQGYYFARPLSAEAMAFFLERNGEGNLTCPYRAG